MRFTSRFASIAAVLLAAGSAQALTMTPNPMPVVDGFIEGQYELVAVTTGLPGGGIVLGGSTSPTAMTLVFRADVTVAQADFLIMGVQLAGSGGTWVDLDGFGWIPGAGTDIASGVEGLPGAVLFTPASSVLAGQSSDLVFLSYDSPLAFDGTLEFVGGLSLAPIGVGFALLVAEPGALGLLALALCAATGRARRSAGT